MKVNKIGKHLTKSYSEWKEYINENKQYTILKKELPKSIDKTKSVLSKLNTEFLGKCNHYLDVKFIKTKTQEAYDRTKRFINK